MDIVEIISNVGEVAQYVALGSLFLAAAGYRVGNKKKSNTGLGTEIKGRFKFKYQVNDNPSRFYSNKIN